MNIALDATYSFGANLTGVGVYSRELLWGLAQAHPETQLLFCYRPHRFLASFGDRLPPNCRRRLLQEPIVPRSALLFHGVNQRLPRVPLRHAICTFHDLFVLTGNYSSPEFRRRFAEQARHAAAVSERIITVSEFTARQAHQLLGVEYGRLRVIRHGVRPLRAKPASRQRMILHVGAIQKRKNMLRLIRAFEDIDPGWELVLAGSSGFGAAEILTRIHASPRRASIRVLGYVNEAALADLYARASIFAFPSLDEGFGMPVLEAMASGVPVITSNCSALPEVAGDAAILVDPVSIDAIREALERLISDEDLRKNLAERGIQHAQGFSWQQAVAKTWAVYEEVMTGGR